MITLTLPYPISANRYWRTMALKMGNVTRVQTYLSEEAKAFKEEVGWICKRAGIRSPLVGRVAISVCLYPNRPQDFKTRMRKHGATWDDTVQCLDLDNANKVLLDSLKGIAIEDDKWVRRIVSERMEPDGQARVVVTITPIAMVQPQEALL